MWEACARAMLCVWYSAQKMVKKAEKLRADRFCAAQALFTSVGETESVLGAWELETEEVRGDGWTGIRGLGG